MKAREKHVIQSEEKATPSEIRDTTREKSRPIRRSARRRFRDTWIPLAILFLGLATILVLANVVVPGQKQTTSPQTASSPTPTASVPISTIPLYIHPAHVRLYPFPQSNVGLMQPVVDGQGNVWVGEMFANRLARLDSHTGVVTAWIPPDGKNGLMSTTIDNKGVVWFVEQGANYIGRFDPAQQTFRIFPLGSLQGRPLGPQDLQFDARGLLWFTAPAGGRIGRLDPATGAIRTWPVPTPRAGVTPAPFSLTVTRDGQVWFGYISGGAVGRLDPASGKITLYLTADPQAEIFSIDHDAHGNTWFTEIAPGKLGTIDSATGRVTELPIPTVAGHAAALYGLVVAQNGDIWFVNNGAGALVRYAPKDTSFSFFQLALPSSAPYGLALDEAGSLWFTTNGPSTDVVGNMRP